MVGSSGQDGGSKPLTISADQTDVEFLVVGGGPVGSAVALQLGQAGREVLLVDAGASTKKVCGEGLLPSGWSALEDLGVSEQITQRAEILHLRYQITDPTGKAMRVLTAPLTRPAFGVQRPVLCEAFADALAQSRAPVCRGVKFRALSFTDRGVTVELEDSNGTHTRKRCRFLIGADGLHSKVRRAAGLASEKPRRYRRWGTRIYLRSQEIRRGVEVTLGESVESYLTPLGDHLYGLAFLWSPHLLGRPLPGEGPPWERLLNLLGPGVRAHLPRDADFFGPEHAIGPLQQLVKSPLHANRRVALVGDAAGYLDALTGEGLCLGLSQARALCDLILSGRVERYPDVHSVLKRRHRYVVSGLLWLLEHPQVKERVFASLSQSPELFCRVIRFAVEEAPLGVLMAPDLGKFLRKLILG